MIRSLRWGDSSTCGKKGDSVGRTSLFRSRAAQALSAIRGTAVARHETQNRNQRKRSHFRRQRELLDANPAPPAAGFEGIHSRGDTNGGAGGNDVERMRKRDAVRHVFQFRADDKFISLLLPRTLQQMVRITILSMRRVPKMLLIGDCVVFLILQLSNALPPHPTPIHRPFSFHHFLTRNSPNSRTRETRLRCALVLDCSNGLLVRRGRCPWRLQSHEAQQRSFHPVAKVESQQLLSDLLRMSLVRNERSHASTATR